jgi:hypothetical protein
LILGAKCTNGGEENQIIWVFLCYWFLKSYAKIFLNHLQMTKYKI